MSCGLFPEMQSAYRQFHSTETALLRVRNDILLNINNQHVTLLVFLNLNAAFDTIDHTVLPQRLEDKFGVQWNCIGVASLVSVRQIPTSGN